MGIETATIAPVLHIIRSTPDIIHVYHIKCVAWSMVPCGHAPLLMHAGTLDDYDPELHKDGYTKKFPNFELLPASLQVSMRWWS